MYVSSSIPLKGLVTAILSLSPSANEPLKYKQSVYI